MSPTEYEKNLKETVEPIFDESSACRDEGILQPKVVYGYFPCQSDGDDLVVFDPDDHDKEIERFTFPRQAARTSGCASATSSARSTVGEKDVIGIFLRHHRSGSQPARKQRSSSRSNRTPIPLHARLSASRPPKRSPRCGTNACGELGIEATTPKIRELFTQKYRGSRYSFGYPACPEMSDQESSSACSSPIASAANSPRTGRSTRSSPPARSSCIIPRRSTSTSCTSMPLSHALAFATP
jgi:5-methyltetrahydrofolate--homocysteine methyltransferase